MLEVRVAFGRIGDQVFRARKGAFKDRFVELVKDEVSRDLEFGFKDGLGLFGVRNGDGHYDLVRHVRGPMVQGR